MPCILTEGETGNPQVELFYEFKEFKPKFFEAYRNKKNKVDGTEITKSESEIYKFIKERGGVICQSIMEEFCLSRELASTKLLRLYHKKLITRMRTIAPGINGAFLVYFSDELQMDERRAIEIIASEVTCTDAEYAPAILMQKFNQLQQPVRQHYGQSV